MLTEGEEALLKVVLEHAGDMENEIHDGVVKAMRGVNDKARRTYLRGILTRKATERIRKARQKVTV